MIATLIAPVWQPLIVTAALGERVAAYRRRRGLSQTVVAGLIGRSESWLSQLERGVRATDSLTVLLKLSEVLHVPVDALIGPGWPAPNTFSSPAALDAIRDQMYSYPQLQHTATRTTAAEVRLDRTAVAEDLAQFNLAYQGARYADAIASVGTLLERLDRLITADHPADWSLYTGVYTAISKLALKLDDSALGLLAADRAATGAAHTQDPVDRGMAARQISEALLVTGQVELAERLALQTLEDLGAGPNQDDPHIISLRGTHCLLTAVIAAKRTERYLALQRLQQAEDLARQLGADANHCWTAFGPTNVAIHAVSVAAFLGDAAAAIAAAEAVDLHQLPPGLVSRRAQIHLDLAWAAAQQHRDSDAILQLLEAEQIAPELIRYPAAVKASLSEILARTRVPNMILHDLAVRVGVLE